MLGRCFGELGAVVVQGGFVQRGLFFVEVVTEFLGALDDRGTVGAFDEGDVADLFTVENDGGEKQLVGAVTLFRLFAIDQRIGKSIHVARGLPDLRMHDDAGVEPFDVVAAVHEVAPPGLLDVVAQFDAEGAVIVKAVIAAVDFGGGEDEAAALAEADDIFHECVIGCWSCHKAKNDGLWREWVKR